MKDQQSAVIRTATAHLGRMNNLDFDKGYDAGFTAAEQYWRNRISDEIMNSSCELNCCDTRHSAAKVAKEGLK